MARKSRRAGMETAIAEIPKAKTMPTAIYARLSVENSGKAETVDVIANQIEICKSYVAASPDLELADVYSDNGRTGTVFDRPEFNRLMDDIRSGRIKQMRARLKTLRLKEAQISSGKLYCYNLYAEGSIGRDEYMKKRADCVQQLAEIEADIQSAEKQIHALEAERTPLNPDAGPLCRLFDGTERLTAELSHAFLKAVYVHPGNRVELKWKVTGFPDA